MSFCLQDGVEDVAYDLKQEEVANQKEMDQPYIAGYEKNKQANYKDPEDNYIIAYNRQDAKDSYITKYGTKEASKNSGMEHKKHVSLCFLKLKVHVFSRVMLGIQ